MEDFMNCKTTMNTFFELDKNERLPVKITLHLLRCKKCRSLVRSLTLAEKASSKSLLQTKIPTDDSVISIMQHIEKQTFVPSQQHQVSLAKWIIGGIFMIGLMLFFNFSTNKSPSLTLLFAIVFSGIVCAYCAIFVGSNLDFFVKKIQKQQRMEFFS